MLPATIAVPSVTQFRNNSVILKMSCEMCLFFQRVPTRSLSSPTPGTPTNTETTREPIRTTGNNNMVDREQVYTWIMELTNPETREHALIELRYI